jgi:hypothetical protein
MESEIWMTLHTARGANAGFLLWSIVAIWVAARFSSVAAEKGVNMVGKIICSIFALAVFGGNFVIGTLMMNSYIGHAMAFQMLKDTGVEITPMASGFVEYWGTVPATMPNAIGMVLGTSGLLIALAPLWFNTSD